MVSRMTVDKQCQWLDTGLRRRGVLILATFALAWAMAGSTGLTDATIGRVLFAVIAAVIVLVGVSALRPSRLPVSGRQRHLAGNWVQRFNWVVAVEAAGIAAAVVICLAAAAPRAIPAAVCLVVGAHFLPLASIFDQPQYRWTGMLLLLAASAGLFMTAAGLAEAAIATVGFGAATILCGTALHVLVRG
jgi:hypothetical protein